MEIYIRFKLERMPSGFFNVRAGAYIKVLVSACNLQALSFFIEDKLSIKGELFLPSTLTGAKMTGFSWDCHPDSLSWLHKHET